jgi:hypothetical protein
MIIEAGDCRGEYEFNAAKWRQSQGTRHMTAHEELQNADGIRRRSVLRGGLLVGAGLATAGVASAVLTGTAEAVSPQPNWAYCEGCRALWYTGDSKNPWGACPFYDSGHSKSDSYNYDLYNNLSNSDGYQGNWRWCSVCDELYTTLHTPSYCPGSGYSDGGPHTEGAGSFDYYLQLPAVGVYLNNPQAYWLWCCNCQSLYFQGSTGTSNGTCPDPNAKNPDGSDGAHNGSKSEIYCLTWNGSF